jgi:hypothetical protein
MKVCPTCRKTYQDEGLNFCLEDGSVLTMAAQEAPPTMVMQSPPATNPNPVFQNPPDSRQTWEQQPGYSIQPKKKSKAWLWVTGVLALGLLLCGGGGIGMVIFFAAQREKEKSRNSNPPPPPPANSSRTNSSTTNTSPGSTRSKLSAVDMSGWAKSTSADVTSEYTNGELVLGTRQKGYYYVLISQEEDTTENADTRVSVRNVDDLDSSMGYGLVFHSNPQPLKQDYSFLIDAKKKRYRVVRHIPSDEPIVVRWTNSSAIKDGTQENVLEVRDNNGNIDLYINGEKVTTIRNTYGYKGGVAGVYSGDAARAGFSKLEIRR